MLGKAPSEGVMSLCDLCFNKCAAFCFEQLVETCLWFMCFQLLALVQHHIRKENVLTVDNVY